ncbi:hypothetical protein D3C71_1850450 [compost metagenome]
MGLVEDPGADLPRLQRARDGGIAQLLRRNIEDRHDAATHPLHHRQALRLGQGAVQRGGDGMLGLGLQVVHLILHQGLQG